MDPALRAALSSDAPEQMGHGRTADVVDRAFHYHEMFRAIPAAQLCVVPNSGHGAMPAETMLTFLR